MQNRKKKRKTGDLAVAIYDIKDKNGRRVCDSFDTAKNVAKFVKSANDVLSKGSSAVHNKDAGAGVDAVAAALGAAGYAGKLGDWEVAGKLFQQLSKTVGMTKALKMATPGGQASAAVALSAEKILLLFGIATKSQGLNCGSAIATLAADTVALAGLSAATGGIGAAFFTISYSFTVVDAVYQCSLLLDERHR